MEKWRARIPPARWRKIHFCILAAAVCLVLLYLGLEGWMLDGIPVLAAMALVVLDIIGGILFFRCPVCGAQLWQYWSGHCHSCGTFVSMK